MKTMTTNFIGSFFAIAFSIEIPKKQLLSNRFLTLLFAILANGITYPVLANSLEIIRAIPDNDQVILKVRVVDDNRVPIKGLKLNPEDFEIQTTDANHKIVSLKTPKIEITPPEKTKPDPAYLVILLDLSGSMKNRDNSGQIKLTGAIKGIQAFIDTIESEKLPVEIAVVPFGIGGGKCTNNYPVDQDGIKNRLEAAPYKTSKLQLQDLANIDINQLCASTNLYQPLGEAVQFLGTDKRFQENSSKLPPRLGVILFTDGFDSYDRNNEKKRFEDLRKILDKYPQVTVHTMGYGESLSQLYHRNRAHCNSIKSLTVDNLLEACQGNVKHIKEFIVDENRLTQIADQTKGIAKFPNNSQEVIDNLKTFLTTLREYEIIYQQPGADKASSHQTQVIVNSPSQGLNNLASEKKNVQLNNFFYHSLSGSERLIILIITIILSVGGALKFNSWSKQLKKEVKKNLSES